MSQNPKLHHQAHQAVISVKLTEIGSCRTDSRGHNQQEGSAWEDKELQ